MFKVFSGLADSSSIRWTWRACLFGHCVNMRLYSISCKHQIPSARLGPDFSGTGLEFVPAGTGANNRDQICIKLQKRYTPFIPG